MGPSLQDTGTPSELDSIVQPGHLVFEYEFPPEMQGTLTKTGVSLSDGAYADVYKGYWTQNGKPKVIVAIKCIRRIGVGENQRFMTVRHISGARFEAYSIFKQRIKRETVIWQAAEHRNIVPFLGYQIINHTPMLVSPWYDNGDLSTYITNHPELEAIKRLQLVSAMRSGEYVEAVTSDQLLQLRDAARGLAHLHGLNPPIAHGDMKPENIIVMDNLEAALCDFGVSRVIRKATGLTTSGTNRGTAGYQSKEVIDELPLTTMADVFAFGGVGLAVLSGKRPFWKMQASTMISVAIYSDEVPQPEDHPEIPASDPLWNLFNKCWKPIPEERPTMAAVLDEVRAEGWLHFAFAKIVTHILSQLEKEIQLRSASQVL
ncbi:hypothetical protein FRC00_007190 [Tulasnella sp. 408]|nr:hypothetical protein FRC00_007190 [Tulasnella sp. 408]